MICLRYQIPPGEENILQDEVDEHGEPLYGPEMTVDLLDEGQRNTDPTVPEEYLLPKVPVSGFGD